jgi:hypothetical protein
LADNKELLKYLKKFNEESTKLFSMLTKNKVELEKRINKIKNNYTNKRNIASSYEKMYSILTEMNSK